MRSAFLAQLVGHMTLALVVVNSSPNVGHRAYVGKNDELDLLCQDGFNSQKIMRSEKISCKMTLQWHPIIFSNCWLWLIHKLWNQFSGSLPALQKKVRIERKYLNMLEVVKQYFHDSVVSYYICMHTYRNIWTHIHVCANACLPKCKMHFLQWVW